MTLKEKKTCIKLTLNFEIHLVDELRSVLLTQFWDLHIHTYTVESIVLADAIFRGLLKLYRFVGT